MSRSSSLSESGSMSDDSDVNFVRGYVIPVNQDETGDGNLQSSSESDIDTNVNDEGMQTNRMQTSACRRPYADEPLADEEWTRQYRKEKQLRDKRAEDLLNRFSGIYPVSSWCTCGNCKTELLNNLRECQCCREIAKCSEALTSNLVLQEVETPLVCIRQHPGFSAVCLNKWSLRQAAVKFKRLDKKRYRQTGSEEAFLRSVSYREFTQLVHGFLGNTRIPLPACALDAIRQEFTTENETFTGFVDNSDEEDIVEDSQSD